MTQFAANSLQLEQAAANIADAVRDIVVTIAPDGIITALNPAFERISGWPRERWVGQHFAALVHQDDLQLAAGYLQHALQGGSNPPFELRILRSDGAYFSGEFFMSELCAAGSIVGFLGICRDVSDRKRLDEALRQSAQLFRAAFDNTLTGMTIASPTGVYLQANPAFCAMLGYDESEIIGRHIVEFTHPDDQALADEHINRALRGEGESFRLQKRYLHKLGQTIWVDLTTALVREAAGAPLFWVNQVQDITRRRETEQALHESQERYHSLFTHSADAILLTSPDGSILDANPAACRIFGLSKEEIIAAGRAGLVDLDDPRVAIFLAERERTGQAQFEYTHRRGDGSTFIGDVTSTVYADSEGRPKTSMIIRDTTERQSAAEAIRLSEARFRAAYDHAAIGMALVALDGGWLQVNRALINMLGYSEAELQGRTFQDITHPDDLNADLEHVAQMLRREISSYQMEKRYVHKDGHFVWALLSVALVHDAADNPLYFISQIQDISDRKSAEAELSAALAAQQESNRRLAELSKSKSDFLSMITHEFRTPLTSIRGFSELIHDEELDPAARLTYSAEISKAAMRLNNMINELLDLDRMESGRMPLHRAWIDLNRIIVEEVETARPTAPRHLLLLQLADDIPLLLADGTKLTRVITNLLSNAIKYSPNGGPILISSWLENERAHVSVHDRGIGIPADALEKVFERYARIESGPGRNIQGTGLGLPIVKQIIELHGGRIWVHSTIGKGSTFHFTIPLEAASPARD